MEKIFENLYRIIKLYIEAILDIIYPEKGICFICNKIDEDIKGKYICDDCYESISFTDKGGCEICGKRLHLNFKTCEDCLDYKRYFNKVYSPIEYKGIIKDAIYKYKYKNNAYMYKLFGRLLMNYLNDFKLNDIDVIVPVPLHRSKLRTRGFNQAALISKYISRNLNINIENNNLIRQKKTLIQNKLNKYERIENIKDAFKVKCSEKFKDKKILLIDDIYTTGATVNECSRILLRSGAEEVNILTIANVIHN